MPAREKLTANDPKAKVNIGSTIGCVTGLVVGVIIGAILGLSGGLIGVVVGAIYGGFVGGFEGMILGGLIDYYLDCKYNSSREADRVHGSDEKSQPTEVSRLQWQKSSPIVSRISNFFGGLFSRKKQERWIEMDEVDLFSPSYQF